MWVPYVPLEFLVVVGCGHSKCRVGRLISQSPHLLGWFKRSLALHQRGEGTCPLLPLGCHAPSRGGAWQLGGGSEVRGGVGREGVSVLGACSPASKGRGKVDGTHAILKRMRLSPRVLLEHALSLISRGCGLYRVRYSG